MTKVEWNRLAPPAKSPVVSGVARCPASHEWRVRTHWKRTMQHGLFGSFPESTRVVDPVLCPACDAPYDEVVAKYFNDPCPKTWAFSPAENWRCQHAAGAGHEGVCIWPNPADTVT